MKNIGFHHLVLGQSGITVNIELSVHSCLCLPICLFVCVMLQLTLYNISSKHNRLLFHPIPFWVYVGPVALTMVQYSPSIGTFFYISSPFNNLLSDVHIWPEGTIREGNNGMVSHRATY